MITHARPATNRFPIVQKAAIKLNIEPRLDFGWNSAKYDQMTGPEPPKLTNKLNGKNEDFYFHFHIFDRKKTY